MSFSSTRAALPGHLPILTLPHHITSTEKEKKKKKNWGVIISSLSHFKNGPLVPSSLP